MSEPESSFDEKDLDGLLGSWEQDRIDHPWKSHYHDALVWTRWHTPNDLYRKVRRFVQRGLRGYAQEDLWNLDHYLMSVLIPAFKDYNHNNVGWSGEGTFEDYKAKVDQMIKGFESAKRIQEIDIPNNEDFVAEHKRLESEFHDAMKIFDQEFFSFWW